MDFHDPHQDDSLEIEVGSLHASAPSSETPTIKPLFERVQSRRAQMRRGGVVTGALVVVVVALILSIAPTREALRGAIFGPTPVATDPIRSGEDSLYVTLNPNWGTVTLDDRRIVRLPLEGIDQPLPLSRGVHVLRWRVDPIINFACRLTVPSAPGDTCPTRIGIQPQKKGVASVVAFQLSLANVAPTYHASLLAAIQNALDGAQSSDIVRPGEHYFGAPTPTVATQPLRATLRWVSDAEDFRVTCPSINSGPGTDCMMNGDCREICTAPWQIPTDTNKGIWQAYIVAHASWHITTLDERVVVDNRLDDGGTSLPGNDEHPVPITIGWDGSQWHVKATFTAQSVADPFSAPGCLSARDAITYVTIIPPELPGDVSVSWFYVQGDPIASGCLMAAVPMSTQGVPDTSSQGISRAFLVLYRFGVPLAANAGARSFWGSTMPAADAYEQTMAQKLAEKLLAMTGAKGG